MEKWYGAGSMKKKPYGHSLKVKRNNYNKGIKLKDITRVEDLLNGYLIWNSAKQGIKLVQEHCLYVVKDGNKNLFWEDD